MSSLARSMISSAGRPLRLRLRADLACREHIYQGRRCWVVKDPLTLKYYRFEEEEYRLLSWLDGERSLQSLQDQFEASFAPQKISLQEIHQFVGAMHQAALVNSDARGQGATLAQRRKEHAKRQRWSAFTNVLCIRFKGIDPDRLLGWLNTRLGWIFSAPAVFAGLCLAVIALTLVLVEFDVFQSRLPAFHEFFGAKNWLWLAATLAVTKVIHEFGHGLTCKRFGGECHEMGVMLLVLTPCLYCNVTDSWMLPNKWRRAAIGAAGMYVEILLASICTLIWWRTQPGILNYLCLNVMFVSSVSTIVFNANPLLRYDGYYILSDVLEIPNLRQKATTILQRKAGAWLLGFDETDDPFLPARGRALLAAYSVAAGLYRWVVVFSIVWFLNSVLEPYGLKPVGQVLAAASLYGLFVHPMIRLFKHLSSPGRMDQVNKLRFAISSAGVCGLLLALLYVPLPHYIRCHVHVRPRSAAPIYVEVAGNLTETHVKPGQSVRRGDPIVTLRNTGLDLQINALQGRREQLDVRAATANSLAVLGVDEAALELDELLETMGGVDRQIEEQEDDKRRLVVRAKEDGEVIAIPNRRADRTGERLASWSGQPTATKNVGAYYPFGQLVCYVGDPNELQAILMIDGHDMEFVHEGQPVHIVLDQRSDWRIMSKLSHVSKRRARSVPDSLAGRNGGPIASHPSRAGKEEPLETYFEGSASVDDPEGRLIIGAVGQARIRAGWRTVGQRILRYFQQISY